MEFSWKKKILNDQSAFCGFLLSLSLRCDKGSCIPQSWKHPLPCLPSWDELYLLNRWGKINDSSPMLYRGSCRCCHYCCCLIWYPKEWIGRQWGLIQTPKEASLPGISFFIYEIRICLSSYGHNIHWKVFFFLLFSSLNFRISMR